MPRKFLILLLAALAPVALAQPQQLSLAEGEFAAQRAKIEQDLNDGKTYVELSSADRAKVMESLNRMSSTLQGVESVDQLSEDQKVLVFNDQEVVNTILTQAAEDSQLVCERTRPTGSNRPVTRCETVAERRRRRENDQQNLQRAQRGIGPPNN
ncbi:MAG TPA: hypothetical protein VKZ64_04830 [Arenimonas sp.]|jgi:hypothetical protein|nr:hypothetical protein [Arenimonas sp.]